jgi:hypothetical protein
MDKIPVQEIANKIKEGVSYMPNKVNKTYRENTPTTSLLNATKRRQL